jgi:dihydrofolate synthase/folylpolyglutamate synthase
MTAREYLFSLEQIGIKLGLEQIRLLVVALDCPDLAFPSIVVAGTNGKGSVSAMIERGLRDAGYRTGRYTSPHLTSIEERVAIDGLAITPAAFDRIAARVRLAATTLPFPPSFFEATTAVALEAFRDAHVDVAVLEVGLGGRLDATNAVTPVLSVITSVDLDHQEYLGRSIETIAAEKAGIIKPRVPTVLGANSDVVRAVVEKIAAERGGRLLYAPDGVTVRATMYDGKTSLTLTTPVAAGPPLTLGLRGRHQIDNAITATRALEALDAGGLLRVPPASRRAALEQVEWPARLEMRYWRQPEADQASIEVLIDGAHNPAGAEALARYLNEAFGRPLPIIFAAMADKDIDGMLRALIPCARGFICTAPRSPRAAPADALAARVAALAPGTPVMTAATAALALAGAARFGAPIVVAGSLYLAGEIREVLS